MSTLDDLRRAAELLPPGATLTLTRESFLAAFNGNGIGGASRVQPIETAVLPTGNTEPDRLLSAKEVAERMGTSKRWVYAHRRNLPFTKELPGGSIRFSERGLTRYMERQ